MMDVIIIPIVILFKVWEKLKTYEHVLSTAYKDSSNSRENENVSSESSEKIAELKFYFVRSSDVEYTLISCVFPNADLMCNELKGSRHNEEKEFYQQVFLIGAFIKTENGYVLLLFNACHIS